MTTTTDHRALPSTTTPTDRVLTGSLVVAPLIWLAADTTYAIRGWDDAGAGVLHVLGAIAFGLVFLRVAAWLPRTSALAAAIVLVALVAVGGNAGYGFDTIHMSLGDPQLVDQAGAANLIKPLGLFFPLAVVLTGAGLVRLGLRWQGLVAGVAGVAFGVAHIANIGPLAVAVSVAFVVAFGSLLQPGFRPAAG